MTKLNLKQPQVVYQLILFDRRNQQQAMGRVYSTQAKAEEATRAVGLRTHPDISVMVLEHEVDSDEPPFGDRVPLVEKKPNLKVVEG